MNQRITNQLHQLSTIGSLMTVEVSSESSFSIYDAIKDNINSSATHVQIVCNGGSLGYRADGNNVTPYPFGIESDESKIFSIRDFKKAFFVLYDSGGSALVYIQALGE